MNKSRRTWMIVAGPSIIIVGLVMLVISWRKWLDPLVDFGRELYVPWQLSQGEVLYRDIAYFNGPLSPYFNALLFKTLGVGLMTLVIANMAILTVLTFLAYRLLSLISSRFAATAACVCFLVVFALAQYTNTGNYNFICPYSHELTHGLLLSFTGIYLLSRYLNKPRPIFFGLVGLCLGLILLTKVEVFLAAVLALVVGLILVLRQEKPAAVRLLKLVVFFIVGLVIPLVCFVVYFSLHMPLDQVLRSLFFSYSTVVSGDLARQKFYLSTLGLDEPWKNLLRIFAVIGWYILLLGLAAMADWLLSRFTAYRKYIQPVVFFVGLVAGLLLFHIVNWFDCLRPLPLFMVILGVGLLVVLDRGTHDVPKRNRLTLAFVMTFFSLLMLSKMILNVHAYQYGFALAAPATMVFVVFLLDWLPRLMAGKLSGGWVFKTVISAIFIVALIWHFDTSRKRFTGMTEQISQGSDAFWASSWPKGQALSQALQGITEQVGPDQTFVVFPEGVMLNYLVRRSNPTRYISFVPPELIMFGQKNILAALRDNPPDYVIRLPRGLGEYGYSSFTDYAPELANWLEDNYSPEQIIGQSRQIQSHKIYVYPIYIRKRIN